MGGTFCNSCKTGSEKKSGEVMMKTKQEMRKKKKP